MKKINKPSTPTKQRIPLSIISLYEKLKVHKHDEKFIKDLMQKEEVSNIIKTILEKEERQIPEIYILKTYLYQLKKFIEILTSDDENLKIDPILIKVCKVMKTETFEENSFLMRIGEKGTIFYVTLSGSVVILVPKEYIAFLNRDQYINYLKFLYNNKEIYLLEKTFSSNESVFLIDREEFEQFDSRYVFHGIPLEEYLLLINGKKKYEDKEKELGNEKIEENNIENIDEFELEFKMQQNFNSINHIKKNEIFYKPFKLKIFGYVDLVELGIGSSFGEVALTKLNNERTATIFVKNKSVFGTLTVQDFKELMKGFLEKIKRTKIFFVFSTPLFKNLHMGEIVRSYWNYFVERKIDKGKFLFQNGDLREEIFFLQKGIIKLYIPQCNYMKLNSLICEIKNIYCDDRNISEIQKDITLTIVNQGEILGMEDCVCGNYYFCNAICESENAVFFSIDLKFLYKIINEYDDIKLNWRNLQDKKNSFILDRLDNILRVFKNSVHGEIKQGENNKNLTRIENFFNTKIEIKKKKGKKKLGKIILGNLDLKKKNRNLTDGNIIFNNKENINSIEHTSQNSFANLNTESNFYQRESQSFRNIKLQFNPILNIRRNISHIKNDENSIEKFSKNGNYSYSLFLNSTSGIMKNKNLFKLWKSNFRLDDKNYRTLSNGIDNKYLKKLLYIDGITKALFENRLKKEDFQNYKNFNYLSEFQKNKVNIGIHASSYDDNKYKTINSDNSRIKNKLPSFYYYGKRREKYSKLYDGEI